MQRIEAPAVLMTFALLAAAAPPALPAQDADPVYVINLPEVQRVSGGVTLDEPPPQSQLVRVAREVVPPVRREDTTALLDAGSVDTAGFTGAMLSLGGQIRADHYSPGAVGALLIPEESGILDALREAGQFLFPLEVEAPARYEGGLYFSSQPTAVRLSFPRYRVFLYNTTDRSAEATLYVYLTN